MVFVSGTGDVASSVEAMKQGAIDFLEKPADPDALLAAVMRALAVEAEWRRTRDRIDSGGAPPRTAHPREREVLNHVAQGKSNKQIASELGTSAKTVKVHRGRVMHKLGSTSVVDLVHLTERQRGSIRLTPRPGPRERLPPAGRSAPSCATTSPAAPWACPSSAASGSRAAPTAPAPPSTWR